MTQLVITQKRTPVVALEGVVAGRGPLWVKRDDVTDPGYGGNKVRKLGWILAAASAAKATRLVTVGAAGSHHVLATAYFGTKAGFDVEAILLPQRATSHVEANLRAGIGLGLKVWAARRLSDVPLLLAARMGRGAFFIPMGGSSLTGALGYVEAAIELRQQVDAGELPEPDLCFVTLGSGGTAAGLVAGLAACGMRTRVVGVTVAEPPMLVELYARFLARRMATRTGAEARAKQMMTTRAYLGRGYGEPTAAGEEAIRLASRFGLTLDATYTAKTFAAVTDALRDARAPNILYWHTLSSADLTPLLERAPNADELAPSTQRLLLPAAART